MPYKIEASYASGPPSEVREQQEKRQRERERIIEDVDEVFGDATIWAREED